MTEPIFVDRYRSILFIAGITLVGVMNLWVVLNLEEESLADYQRVLETHEALELSGDLLNDVTNAETGQRGFILTNKPEYLEPYYDGINSTLLSMGRLAEKTADYPIQQQRLDIIKSLIDKKFSELNETISLNRAGQTEAALKLISSDVGNTLMNEIRAEVALFEQEEREILSSHRASFLRLQEYTVLVFIIESIALFTVLVILFWSQKNTNEARNQRDEALLNSILDPLTGLTNRRFMKVELEKEMLSSKRHGYDMSVLMIDIDHFKMVNDTYGHLVGDKVLDSISTIFKESLRASDLAIRYGGEEFLIALSHSSYGAAEEKAEQLRRLVQDIVIPELKGANITVSIGVTELLDDDNTAEDIIARADQALYKAKHDGRNCCRRL